MEERTTINVSKLVDALANLAKITLKVYNNDSLMSLLGVSERTLRKYRDEGYLPYTKIGDKFFYSDEDIRKFLEDIRKFLLSSHFDAFRISRKL